MSKAFDLIAFRDFCAGKGDEVYPYTRPWGCALFQFLTHADANPRWVGPYEWKAENGRIHAIPGDIADAVADSESFAEGRACDFTFSALASRLSALIREGE